MPRKKITQLLENGTLLDLGNTLSDEDLTKLDEGGQTTYDLVIRTQEEFDIFCDSLDNETCEVCSVLLVGDGGYTPFIRKNGKGLKLPNHLTTLCGINMPIIIIANFNSSNSMAGIYRESSLGTPGEKIENIILCISSSTDCYHFRNLSGIKNCTILSGETNDLLTEGTMQVGFMGCTNIDGCMTLLISNNGGVASFINCQTISNCTTINGDMAGGTAISYSGCMGIVGAIDITNDFGLPEPTIYDESCTKVGVVREDIEKLNSIEEGAQRNVQADWNATSGDSFIKNKPTIPTVNNGTLTIQQNGTTVATFGANSSSNITANISVPKMVTLTQAEYDALTTKDSNTYYFIKE